MAGVSLPSSSSRKKSLDAEVNLVPFIDLLSVSICFLLMTAVWVQIGTVEVRQANGTEAAEQTASLDLDVRFTQSGSVAVSVRSGGKVLKSAEFKGASTQELAAQLDGGIQPLLLGKTVGSAKLTPAEGVPYGDLITVMDVLRKHEIVNLGVVPVGG
jgi:biopolymer transport protein TolR